MIEELNFDRDQREDITINQLHTAAKSLILSEQENSGTVYIKWK